MEVNNTLLRNNTKAHVLNFYLKSSSTSCRMTFKLESVGTKHSYQKTGVKDARRSRRKEKKKPSAWNE